MGAGHRNHLFWHFVVVENDHMFFLRKISEKSGYNAVKYEKDCEPLSLSISRTCSSAGTSPGKHNTSDFKGDVLSDHIIYCFHTFLVHLEALKRQQMCSFNNQMGAVSHAGIRAKKLGIV